MQGFNMGRYIPPEALDAGLSANQASGKGHALGARARKSHLGILIVRFEMPFAIWCGTCPESSNNRLIGQGVRFNAEKKKVGNYHSTPVWSFKMKHVTCGGWIEIRTDPKSSDFVVTEGAKRRDTGGEVWIAAQLKEEDEREKKRSDAFAALEVKVDDKKQAKTEANRIEELKSLKERDWSDPYASSQKLRREFRVGRKARERDAKSTEALQERMSLGIDLVEETEADRRRAGLVEFGDGPSSLAEDYLKAASKPLFTNNNGSRRETPAHRVNLKPSNRHRSKESRVQMLHEELSNNTRAATDPFLIDLDIHRLTKPTVLAGIKKKSTRMPEAPPQSHSNDTVVSASDIVNATAHGQSTPEDGTIRLCDSSQREQKILVTYDSD